MAEKRRIIIFDTTLRDGEQSPGCSMNLSEKLEVARALEALRVDVIEAGFPIASPGDFEAVQAISQEVRGDTCTMKVLTPEGEVIDTRTWQARRYHRLPRNDTHRGKQGPSMIRTGAGRSRLPSGTVPALRRRAAGPAGRFGR